MYREEISLWSEKMHQLPPGEAARLLKANYEALMAARIRERGPLSDALQDELAKMVRAWRPVDYSSKAVYRAPRTRW